MPNFVKVADINDLKPGENKIVNVNGEEVGLFNVDGQFYAIGNTCPHKGGPLGEDFLEENIVTCPWHGWRFDVKTGLSPIIPNAKVLSYKVKVEGNDVMVSLG